MQEGVPAGPDWVDLTPLRQASSSTIATLLFKRGLRNQFIQGVRLLGNRPRRLFGPAFTLRHIPAREDLDRLEGFADPRHPQRRAVEEVPVGHVLIMDCHRDTTAASAGAILATRLQVRGCAGLVTDGGLRDVESIADLDMPAYCAGPSAPTNLTKHHALELNVPIGCGGAPVYPGDILLGDGDGVIVIPRHLAAELAVEIGPMEAFEAFALAEVQAGQPVIGTYPPNAETIDRYQAFKAGTYVPGRGSL